MLWQKIDFSTFYETINNAWSIILVNFQAIFKKDGKQNYFFLFFE